MARIASATGVPCATRPSTWRSLATISSGVCRFVRIVILLRLASHTSGRTTSKGADQLEHALPHARLGPATEAGLPLDPPAKALGQIAPGDASPIAVEHGLDKQPVVLGGHAHMAQTSGQQISDPRPLIIPQAVASHRSAPHRSPLLKHN